jgi:hypothetical protein
LYSPLITKNIIGFLAKYYGEVLGFFSAYCISPWTNLKIIALLKGLTSIKSQNEKQ